ncbi:hypothetical protein NA57DRAFT_55186 [Rhizodiscina lignyota]|uniref:Uncharacterized protein n=1 Tax=Rhizodiscina lignyota TaxID=1504668 RepID=A0A9P4MB84_9PEZI|nr:hypothetical protein NA57DRAFT_55186 [Rhizodiscina lignyota]
MAEQARSSAITIPATKEAMGAKPKVPQHNICGCLLASCDEIHKVQIKISMSISPPSSPSVTGSLRPAPPPSPSFPSPSLPTASSAAPLETPSAIDVPEVPHNSLTSDHESDSSIYDARAVPIIPKRDETSLIVLEGERLDWIVLLGGNHATPTKHRQRETMVCSPQGYDTGRGGYQNVESLNRRVLPPEGHVDAATKLRRRKAKLYVPECENRDEEGERILWLECPVCAVSVRRQLAGRPLKGVRHKAGDGVNGHEALWTRA